MPDRKGRLGVMYLMCLLAQAGLPNQESRPGEDHDAIDLWVKFRPASAGVQVKCGRRKPNKDGSISVPVTRHWRAVWAESKVPVYLVHVQLEHPQAPIDWVDHDAVATKITAHAYWARVNHCPSSTVRLPSDNRVTLSTFAAWLADVERAFGLVTAS